MIVLDGSALLTLLIREVGWEVVAGAATGDDATISSINYTEVLQKAARRDVGAEVVDAVLDSLR